MSYARWGCDTGDGRSSDWYIFYHCDSDDELEGQLLAVWNSDHITMTYPEVRKAYDTGNWPHDHIAQKDYLESCVKDWLDEVEEEYKNVAV